MPSFSTLLGCTFIEDIGHFEEELAEREGAKANLQFCKVVWLTDVAHTIRCTQVLFFAFMKSDIVNNIRDKQLSKGVSDTLVK